MPKVITRRRTGRTPLLNRPNVVLIVTDDQPLGRINSEFMPYLTSEPGGSWVKFPRAVESTPLCGVNRATLYTGQTWQRHGVKTHLDPALKSLNEAETLAVILAAAGYRTGLFGKYENNWPFYQPSPQNTGYVPAGWESFWGRTSTDADIYYNWTAHTNISGAPSSGGATDADYHIDVLSGLASTFIAANDSRPFFAMLTPGSPHSPGIPPTRHASLPVTTVADPPDLNTIHTGAPAWVQALGALTTSNLNTLRTARADTARACRAVDEMINNVFTALTTAGKLENTVVIFLTDNSITEGRKRMGSPAPGPQVDKRTPYYGSLDAQLRIRYPGAVARTEMAPVSSVDIPVSIANWAGATWAHSVDGSKYLGHVAANDPAAVRRPSAYATCEAGSPVPNWGAILRNDGFKYVHWTETNEREVFDTVNDPYEQVNIYGQNSARDAALAAELAQHIANRTYWES